MNNPTAAGSAPRPAGREGEGLACCAICRTSSLKLCIVWLVSSHRLKITLIFHVVNKNLHRFFIFRLRVFDCSKTLKSSLKKINRLSGKQITQLLRCKHQAIQHHATRRGHDSLAAVDKSKQRIIYPRSTFTRTFANFRWFRFSAGV